MLLSSVQASIHLQRYCERLLIGSRPEVELHARPLGDLVCYLYVLDFYVRIHLFLLSFIINRCYMDS